MTSYVVHRAYCEALQYCVSQSLGRRASLSHSANDGQSIYALRCSAMSGGCDRFRTGPWVCGTNSSLLAFPLHALQHLRMSTSQQDARLLTSAGNSRDAS
jgi:hypothetical protein